MHDTQASVLCTRVPLTFPSPSLIFSAVRSVYLHATLLCFHVPVSRSLSVPSLLNSLSQESCTPSKLPCCGVMFPSRSSLVPSFLTSLSITFLLLFLTFLNALLSVNFIYYKFNCGYIKIHFNIFKIYFFMKYLGLKNKETCSFSVKCLFLFSFLF